tara:strand:- start:222 stop:401 length:180 start_codon:yes stop_codon:yes gene_type:complete
MKMVKVLPSEHLLAITFKTPNKTWGIWETAKVAITATTCKEVTIKVIMAVSNLNLIEIN